VAVEVVARRIEDDEVQARARAGLHLVDVTARAPVEWIVERIEVRTLWDRRPALVDRPVRRHVVVLQPRRRLDRRAVSDPALRPEVAPDAAYRDGAAPRQRRRPLANVGLRRANRRRDPLAAVEGALPRFEL